MRRKGKGKMSENMLGKTLALAVWCEGGVELAKKSAAINESVIKSALKLPFAKCSPLCEAPVNFS